MKEITTLKKLIYQIIEVLLRRIGLRICRANNQNLYLQQRMNLVQEIETCYSGLIFPELPPCDNRTELLTKLIGTQVSEAMYLLGFLHKSLCIEGDVCEFGVAQGATSALLANEIRTSDKCLWLFDSFKGLPSPTDKDLLIDDIFNLGSIDKYEGKMCIQSNQVESRIKEISFPFSRVRIIPGFIEETINGVNLPDEVCFAYIDFDFYNPTKTVLNFLAEHLSDGGFAVVDDYNFFSSGVKTAVDEFIEKHLSNFEMIMPYKFAGHFCVLRKKSG